MSEKHVGVSELRKMNKKTLAAETKIVIIHDHAEPVAAMIPYRLYMTAQTLRKALMEMEA